MLLTSLAAGQWPRLLPWALASLVIEYGITLAGASDVDVRAPFFGLGLLIVGELSSVGRRDLSGRSRDRSRNRVIEVVVVGLAAIFVGVVVITAAALPVRASLVLEAIGAAAAVAVFLLLSRLAGPRRRGTASGTNDSDGS